MFQRLKDDERCSDYILDLLEFLEHHMLRINVEKRATVDKIVEKFATLHDHIQRDSKYGTIRTKSVGPNHSRPELVDISESSGKVYVSPSPRSVSARSGKLSFVNVRVSLRTDNSHYGTSRSYSRPQRSASKSYTRDRAWSERRVTESNLAMGDISELVTNIVKSPTPRSASWDFIPDSTFRGLLLDESIKVTADNWKSIRSGLSLALQDIVEFAKAKDGIACWTCIPNDSVSLGDIPLTIASAPVIIPVTYPVPIRAGVAPPDDPLSKVISPRQPISDSEIQAIFKQYPQALGFYILLNGFLQILVPASFDLAGAYEDLPVRFGGLKVSFLPNDLVPIPTYNTQPVPLSNRSPLQVGSFVEARPQASSPTSKTAKLGIKTRDAKSDTYLTVATHLVTKALAASGVTISDKSMKQVKIYNKEHPQQEVQLQYHSEDFADSVIRLV
jgi:hypothetical protein